MVIIRTERVVDCFDKGYISTTKLIGRKATYEMIIEPFDIDIANNVLTAIGKRTRSA